MSDNGSETRTCSEYLGTVTIALSDIGDPELGLDIEMAALHVRRAWDCLRPAMLRGAGFLWVKVTPEKLRMFVGDRPGSCDCTELQESGEPLWDRFVEEAVTAIESMAIQSGLHLSDYEVQYLLELLEDE